MLGGGNRDCSEVPTGVECSATPEDPGGSLPNAGAATVSTGAPVSVALREDAAGSTSEGTSDTVSECETLPSESASGETRARTERGKKSTSDRVVLLSYCLETGVAPQEFVVRKTSEFSPGT